MKMRNNREGMKNDKKVGWKSVKMIKTGANLSVENYKQQNKSAFSIMPKHNRDDVKDIQSGVKRQKVTRIRRANAGEGIEAVRKMIRDAFETADFLSIKQLGDLTQQPQQILKEALQDMCDYESKGENRYKYFLKGSQMLKEEREKFAAAEAEQAQALAEKKAVDAERLAL